MCRRPKTGYLFKAAEDEIGIHFDYKVILGSEHIIIPRHRQRETRIHLCHEDSVSAIYVHKCFIYHNLGLIRLHQQNENFSGERFTDSTNEISR